jgi:hypothetical protein
MNLLMVPGSRSLTSCLQANRLDVTVLRGVGASQGPEYQQQSQSIDGGHARGSAV